MNLTYVRTLTETNPKYQLQNLPQLVTVAYPTGMYLNIRYDLLTHDMEGGVNRMGDNFNVPVSCTNGNGICIHNVQKALEETEPILKKCFG